MPVVAPSFPIRVLGVACLLAGLVACGREPPPEPAAPATRTSADSSGGAISSAPLDKPAPKPTPEEVLAGTQWPAAALGEGDARISCSSDYSTGDGELLRSLDYFAMVDALSPCRDADVVRLHYRGKIDAGFADMVERTAAMATRMGIRHRILDIDSPGGVIEDGIRAGDAMGDEHWTVWVREGAMCHSACVLILAAGDQRLVSGAVGIHRMIRLSSTATTRQQLNAELQQVHSQLDDYLQRNGAATAIADLMMTVPSRDLRLLSADELHEFGLEGSNPVQDDLERLRVLRQCGREFLRRKEAFQRALDQDCGKPGQHVDAIRDCGIGLLSKYGFPDKRCPDEAPMAEYARALQEQGEDRADAAKAKDAANAAPRAGSAAAATP
jgi:ATP-dependent protease ClpP protease subunit